MSAHDDFLAAEGRRAEAAAARAAAAVERAAAAEAAYIEAEEDDEPAAFEQFRRAFASVPQRETDEEGQEP